MPVKEALEFLVFYQLECPSLSCDECPYYQEENDDYDCDSALEDSARIVQRWLKSIPEGDLQNITLEDLL